MVKVKKNQDKVYEEFKKLREQIRKFEEQAEKHSIFIDYDYWKKEVRNEPPRE